MKLLISLLILPLVVECYMSEEEMAKHRNRVKSMFYHAYDSYLEHAFPYDELRPLSCEGFDTWGSFSLTLVDSLDTLLVLGNTSEFERAARIVLETVNVNANVNVSVFETNIRVIGGLLSAHMLAGFTEQAMEDGWPCHGPLLRLAEQFANKLLPAFYSHTGMPYGTVNLKHGVHRLETPITCTAGVGTFLLEFGTLSRISGNPHFERVAMKAMDELWKRKSALGLVGNHINVENGQWTATDSGIGAGVDSYFEYLAKAAVLFNRPDLMRQFREYKKSIDEHIRHEDWFLWASMAKGQVTLPYFQSLEQFWPGVLVLTGDVENATRILLNYRSVLKQYGFSPEFYSVPNQEAVNKRTGYPLRPELAESLVYAYQATRDPMFLRIGVEILEAIEQSARTPCGYASVHDVKSHTLDDRMESFFLAETTKYLYLLFDPNHFLHNPGAHGRVVETTNGPCVLEAGGYIFNTEAHPIDPSIVYCCSAARNQDLEAVRRMEDEIDLLALFDLYPDGIEDLQFELQPEEMPSLDLPVPLRSTISSKMQNDLYEDVEYEVNGTRHRLDEDADDSSGSAFVDATTPPSGKTKQLLKAKQRVENWLKTTASKFDLAGAMKQLANDFKKLVSSSAETAESLAQMEEECSDLDCLEDGCRIVDQPTTSKLLKYLLRLIYDRKPDPGQLGWYSVVPSPVCLPRKPPPESINYKSKHPDVSNLTGLEAVDFERATIDDIDIFMEWDAEKLGRYQTDLMSCSTHNLFRRRFLVSGQVAYSP